MDVTYAVSRDAGTPPLEVLLPRIAAGDNAAFRALYLATSAKLFAIAVRTTTNRDWAEEVLQEVYMSIWQSAARYDPVRGAAMPWLTTLVRHAAIDRRRRAVARGAYLGAPDSALEHLAAPETTDRGVTLSALDLCLQGLEPVQRRAILLAYTQGHTHEELSALLRTPLGTIKSWIRRGLERLRKCLDG